MYLPTPIGIANKLYIPRDTIQYTHYHTGRYHEYHIIPVLLVLHNLIYRIIHLTEKSNRQ